MDKKSICAHQTAKVSLIRIQANMDTESSDLQMICQVEDVEIGVSVIAVSIIIGY
jgi:hypothetical protein